MPFFLSSLDNLSLEGILDKEKSEKNLKPRAVLTRRGLGERGLKGTAVTESNISFICKFKVNLFLIVSDAKAEAFFHPLKTQQRQSVPCGRSKLKTWIIEATANDR